MELEGIIISAYNSATRGANFMNYNVVERSYVYACMHFLLSMDGKQSPDLLLRFEPSSD